MAHVMGVRFSHYSGNSPGFVVRKDLDSATEHLYGTKVHCNLATYKLTNWTLLYSLGLNPKKQSVKVSYT